MKTSPPKLIPAVLLALMLVFTFYGCASIGQKFKEYKAAISNKLSSGAEKSTPGKTSDAKEGLPGENEAYFVYKTRWRYETMACLTEWFTGDAKNQAVLAKANPAVNAKKITVGTAIRIPRALLRTEQPVPQTFAAAYRTHYFKHRVRWPGESLSLIAKWYTGSTANWKIIAAANPRLNPNRIAAGNLIAIPPDMLKTRKPLPRKLAARYTSGYFAHTVRRPSETLPDIAKWYTGNARNSKALAAANADLNPRQLAVGDEIYIPANLLITRDPLPVASGQKPPAQQEMESSRSKPAAPASKKQKFELFGPKQFPKG